MSLMARRLTLIAQTAMLVALSASKGVTAPKPTTTAPGITIAGGGGLAVPGAFSGPTAAHGRSEWVGVRHHHGEQVA
jgi:hypothetical protein